MEDKAETSQREAPATSEGKRGAETSGGDASPSGAKAKARRSQAKAGDGETGEAAPKPRKRASAPKAKASRKAKAPPKAKSPPKAKAPPKAAAEEAPPAEPKAPPKAAPVKAAPRRAPLSEGDAPKDPPRRPAPPPAEPPRPMPHRAPESHPFDEEPRRRGGSGALFGGFARRLVSQGVEALGIGEEVARNIVNDKVNKETVTGLVESALKSRDEVNRLKDEFSRATTKGREDLGRIREDAQKAVGREVRRHLERIDLKDEIAKVLADYSLEITARIHFIPLDEEADAEGDEDGEAAARRRRRKRKKEDVSVRFVRKGGEERMGPEADAVDEPERGGRLHPDAYFDDDDEDYDEG